MDRDYYSRGERKSVEVLDDVVAIKVATDDRGIAPEARSFGTEARVADAGMPRRHIGGISECELADLSSPPPTYRVR